MKLDVKLEVKVEDDVEDIETLTLGSALRAVSDVFGVDKEDLLSPRRAHYITTPRFALMYLGYYMTHNSTPMVGRFLGRDHTTIIHGCRRAIELKRSNKAFADRLEQAEELAKGYERERKKKHETFRKEIAERMESACRGVALEGSLSGDKVVFDGRNTQ